MNDYDPYAWLGLPNVHKLKVNKDWDPNELCGIPSVPYEPEDDYYKDPICDLRTHIYEQQGKLKEMQVEFNKHVVLELNNQDYEFNLEEMLGLILTITSELQLLNILRNMKGGEHV